METTETRKSIVRILDLRPWDSRGGWIWVESYADGRTVECRTDYEYEGLFTRQDDGTWQQQRGTGQYRLPHGEQAARKAIWRDAREDYRMRYGE